MVFKRLLGNRRSKATGVAGLFIDPPEVAYALYDPADPNESMKAGVAKDLPTAIDQLLAWQQENGKMLRAVGVNERLLSRLTAIPASWSKESLPASGSISPQEAVTDHLREKETEIPVVPISPAPWLLQSLQLPVGPRAGAIIDRSGLAVALREDGNTWVAGQWSDAYSRSGSMGSIVLRAANLLAEIIDGRTQISGLRSALPTAIGKEDPLEFLNWVDHEAHQDIPGSLAILDAIHALSRSGDVMADRLVNLIAADIGRTIVAAIEQTRLQDARLRIHLSGRVLERIPNLRAGIQRRIEIVNDSVHLEAVPLMHPGEAIARALSASGHA